MTLTALFRDFLISNKAKQKFEKNFLKVHPEFRKKGGGMNWDSNKYESHIKACIVKEKPCRHGPYSMLGYWLGEATFTWIESEEGGDFWLKLAYKLNQYFWIRRNVITDKHGITYQFDINKENGQGVII